MHRVRLRKKGTYFFGSSVLFSSVTLPQTGSAPSTAPLMRPLRFLMNPWLSEANGSLSS